MIIIKGYAEDRRVEINCAPFDPERSQRVYNHSPDGFNWGYAGSGPAQLALAIMLHFCNSDLALKIYQRFKWDIISKLDQNKDFELTDSDIISWVQKQEEYKDWCETEQLDNEEED